MEREFMELGASSSRINDQDFTFGDQDEEIVSSGASTGSFWEQPSSPQSELSTGVKSSMEHHFESKQRGRSRTPVPFNKPSTNAAIVAPSVSGSVTSIDPAPRLYTGPVLTPLLKLISLNNSYPSREVYPRFCIDINSEFTIIAADLNTTIPWPDDCAVSWNLFGVDFILKGAQIWKRADMPLKGVDGIFGIGFFQRFSYMAFEVTPEGWIMPKRDSYFSSLLPHNFGDQRTLRIYTEVVLAHSSDMAREDWQWRPVIGVGVFLGPDAALNTWMPGFGNYISFICKTEKDKQGMCESATLQTFIGVLKYLKSVRGGSSITPYTRIELYTSQEVLAAEWSGARAKRGDISTKHLHFYERIMGLTKRLAVDMGTDVRDALDILLYKADERSGRAMILFGCEQANVLAELALKSIRPDKEEPPYQIEYYYLRFLSGRRIWIARDELDMTTKIISAACRDFFAEQESQTQRYTETGPGELEIQSERLISPLRDTYGCEAGCTIPVSPESVLTGRTNADEAFVDVMGSDSVHEKISKTIDKVTSQFNLTYDKTSEGAQLPTNSAEIHANEIITRAQVEADRILSQAKMLWIDLIDSSTMASAEAAKARSDAIADAQEIRLRAMAEVQQKMTQAGQETPKLRENVTEAFEAACPALGLISSELEDYRHSAGLIIEKANEEARAILEGAERTKRDMLEKAAEYVRILKENEAEEASFRPQAKQELQNAQLVKDYFDRQMEKIKNAEEARINDTLKAAAILKEEEERLAEEKADVMAEAEKVLKEAEENKLRGQEIISDARLQADQIIEDALALMEGAREEQAEENVLSNMRIQEGEETIEQSRVEIETQRQEIKELKEELARNQKIYEAVEARVKLLEMAGAAEECRVIETTQELERAKKTQRKAVEVMEEAMAKVRGAESVKKEAEALVQAAKEDAKATELETERVVEKALEALKRDTGLVREEAKAAKLEAESAKKEAEALIQDAKKEAEALIRDRMKEAEAKELQIEESKKKAIEGVKGEANAATLKVESANRDTEAAKIEAKEVRKEMAKLKEITVETEKAKAKAEDAKEQALKELEATLKEMKSLKESADELEQLNKMKQKAAEGSDRRADAAKERAEKILQEANLTKRQAKTDAKNIREQALKMRSEAEDYKSTVMKISEKIKAEAAEEATKIKEDAKKMMTEAKKQRQINKDAKIAHALAIETERLENLNTQKEQIRRQMAETNKICEDMKKKSEEEINSRRKRLEKEQEETEKSKKKAKDEVQEILNKAREEAKQIIEHAKKEVEDFPIRGDILGSALPITPENFYKMFLEPKVGSENNGPLSADDFVNLLETAEADVTLGQIVNHCPDATREFFKECENEDRLVHKIELYTDGIDGRLKFKKGERIIPFNKSSKD